MQNNPAARKRLAEDNPFMAGKLLGGGAKTYHISIPSEDNCPILEPITIEKRFDTASRRGLVRFDENGVEHLSALKMIRENVIAPMVGIGGKIRILSEATGPDNVHSIEFEVVE